MTGVCSNRLLQISTLNLISMMTHRKNPSDVGNKLIKDIYSSNSPKIMFTSCYTLNFNTPLSVYPRRCLGCSMLEEEKCYKNNRDGVILLLPVSIMRQIQINRLYFIKQTYHMLMQMVTIL